MAGLSDLAPGTLVGDARAALETGDLAAAARLIDEALELQPGNQESLDLQREIARSEQRRDEAVADVSRRVRGYMNGRKFGVAAQVLDEALIAYPGDLVLGALRAAVGVPRRAAGRRYWIWLLPLVVAAMVVPLATVRSGGAGHEVRRLKASASQDTTVLENALQMAIQDRSWAEANLWVNRLVQMNPRDPRIQKWMDQIDEGSANDRKVASLRADALQAIMARNWSEADAKLAVLAAEAPGNPDAAQLQKLLSDGRKEDAAAKTAPAPNSKKIHGLRASIPIAIQAKRWNEAQKQIAELQELAPGDTEAMAWQKSLGILRTLPGAMEPVAVSRTEPALPPEPGDIVLTSRISAIAGRWAFVNAEAAAVKGGVEDLQRSARRISLEISADGAGDLRFEVGAKSSRRLQFRVTAWHGERLSGSSGAHDYSVKLEPVDGALKLEWVAPAKGNARGGKRLVSGNATLVKETN